MSARPTTTEYRGNGGVTLVCSRLLRSLYAAVAAELNRSTMKKGSPTAALLLSTRGKAAPGEPVRASRVPVGTTCWARRVVRVEVRPPRSTSAPGRQEAEPVRFRVFAPATSKSLGPPRVGALLHLRRQRSCVGHNTGRSRSTYGRPRGCSDPGCQPGVLVQESWCR